MNGFKLLFIPFLCLLISNSTQAQSRSELEKKRKQMEKEIAFTNKLISETSEKQKKNVQYLQVINQQLSTREKLVENLYAEMRVIGESIKESQAVITSLEEDLNNLKAEYAEMLRYSYKTRSASSKLGFIVAAEDFNQAWQRLKFLQYYSEYRQKQMEIIIKTRESLEGKVTELDKQQDEKNELLQKKEEKTELLAELKKKEKELRKEVARKKAAAEELNKAIADLIKKEMKAKESTGESYASTPEAKLISGAFEKNKSQLPWPVQKGFIVSKFGKQAHPTLKGIYTNNKGVDIRTEKGSSVRAIYDGEVRAVVTMRSGAKSVLVRHGAYFTVYSNLDNVLVKPTDKLRAKQEIGTVKVSPEGQAEVHLEVWNGSSNMNPEEWLARR